MKRSKLVSSLSLLMGLCLILGSCLGDEGVSEFQQLQEDVAEIDAYLEANPSEDHTDLVIKDASGIRMVITEGRLDTILIPPSVDNFLDVAYTGRYFSNGQQFADSTMVIKLSSNVIQGWKFALSMMTDDMKATVYIPSGLAYGKSGKGPIPGNAILVFDLHLREINRASEAAQLAADKNTIAHHLDTAEIVAQAHPSGISYVLQSIGTGLIPSLYDQVRIKYTSKLLNGQILGEGVEQGPVNTFSSRVVNYPIHGIVVGLQLMNEGDKSTLYIPSTLAYGKSSYGTIPANANLIFEIELLQVIPYSHDQ